MARFVQQGAFGYRDVPGGASDYNCTHVILTKEEYDKLYGQLNKLKYENYNNREEYDKNIEQYKRECKRAIETGIARGVKSYEAQCSKLQSQIDELQDDLQTAAARLYDETQRADAAEELNKNLIRIARERANQDQKITPKKQKYGYRILSKREYIQRYDRVYSIEEYYEMLHEWQNEHPMKRNSSEYVEHGKATVWKSVLTTPYKATLSKEYVEQLIFTDLKKCKNDMGILCIHHTNGEYAHYYNDDTEEYLNTLYRWNLVDDYNRGYWQIEMYTTDELDDRNGGTW